MKSFRIAVATIFLAIPLSVQGQNKIETDIRFLSDDARDGRGVGTQGLDAAAEFIAERFEANGLQPLTAGFFQEFQLDPTAPALAHSGIGAANVKNVVGYLPGRGALASETIVIGAHYDHLGLGGSGSLDPDSMGVVHNGADDNASGTTALIETSRLLGMRESANHRAIVFIAFTAEELGLLGSDYYVKNPLRPLSDTYGMINMDMVGRLRDNKLITIGTGSATEFPALLEAANADIGLTLTPIADPWGRSDHSSFYAANLPVIHLFTDTHEDYHRTTDDWPTVNLEGISQVSLFTAELAWTMATRADDLTFLTVAQPQSSGGRGYGAYLGSIPDMSSNPGGVRLTGVREGSPADNAGMIAGDILVQIGEEVVPDLQGMTNALRKHRPDQTVTVAVLRDGERIELTVTFGRRGG
jgi:hypothetical protein